MKQICLLRTAVATAALCAALSALAQEPVEPVIENEVAVQTAVEQTAAPDAIDLAPLEAELAAQGSTLGELDAEMEMALGAVGALESALTELSANIEQTMAALSQRLEQQAELAQSGENALFENTELLSATQQTLVEQQQAQQAVLDTQQAALQRIDEQLQRLDEAGATLVQQLNQQFSQLQVQFEQFEQRQQQIRQSVDAVQIVAARGGDTNAFALAEVGYLLRLAGHKAAIEQQPTEAARLLEQAHATLAALGEAAFDGLALQIAERSAALAAMVPPDRAAIAYRLLDFSASLAALPLHERYQIDAERLSAVTPVAPEAPQDNAPWWDHLGHQLTSSVSSVLVVRRSDQPLQPLPPLARHLLSQQLHLLSNAMLVSLQRADSDAWQSNAAALRALINANFAAEDPQTQSALAELDSLVGLDINRPQLPTTTDLVEQWQQLMAERGLLRSAATR